MKTLLLCLGFLLPSAAMAQVLPAFFDVSGVAANDVLNVRQEPSASSPIVGSLPPDLTGAEVVGLSADGKWGRVNIGEVSGWASMSFLQRQNRPDWFALQGGLQCAGTEPFWTLYTDPVQNSVHINTPDEEGPEMDIVAHWPGEEWRPVAAAQFASEDGGGVVTLRGEACSDGMSDMAFGIRADVFLQATALAEGRALQGCCTLVP